MSDILNLMLIADRIDELCKKSGMNRKQMLEKISVLNGFEPDKYKSIVDNMKRGSMPTIDKITMIANYFKCSVDYILCLTDNPDSEKDTYINNHGIQAAKNSSVQIDFAKADNDVNELLDLIQGLPLVKRAEAIIYLNNLKESE